MKHHIFVFYTLVLASNYTHCAFLKKTLSFKSDSEQTITEQKNQIKILNEARHITIALFGIDEKIRRYVHQTDLERIFWELRLTSTNPSNCLQIICDTDGNNKPKITKNLCYPCYTWNLQPLCIGKAILEVEQFKNSESVLKQWLNITIAE